MTGRRSLDPRWALVAVGALTAPACAETDDDDPNVAARFEAAEFGPDSAVPQHTAPDDMHIFDAYVGRFRSMTMHDEAVGKDFHYIVEYSWFDTAHTIVKFTVSTLYVGDERASVNADGFYGYDPFNQRLYTFGAFASGMTGFGAVGSFDRGTGKRITRARSRGPDGVTTYVRDSFESVDADTWTDVTSIWRSDGWRVVYRDTFTRITP